MYWTGKKCGNGKYHVEALHRNSSDIDLVAVCGYLPETCSSYTISNNQPKIDSYVWASMCME